MTPPHLTQAPCLSDQGRRAGSGTPRLVVQLEEYSRFGVPQHVVLFCFGVASSYEEISPQVESNHMPRALGVPEKAKVFALQLQRLGPASAVWALPQLLESLGKRELDTSPVSTRGPRFRGIPSPTP